MDKPEPDPSSTPHHIWCNFFASRRAEDCQMCKDFWERFPYDSPDTEEGLMKKHFPDNLIRVPTPIR